MLGSIVILKRVSFNFCDSRLQMLRPDHHSAIMSIIFLLLAPRGNTVFCATTIHVYQLAYWSSCSKEKARYLGRDEQNART